MSRMFASALVLVGFAAASAREPELPVFMEAFGMSVAVAGDQVLISEPQRQGQPGLVHIYRKGDSGWTEIGQLTGSEDPGDGFGLSMAVDGSTLIVGAPRQGPGAAAYVFERTGDEWRRVARLTPTDTTGQSFFGFVVHLEGDLAYVSSPLEDETRGAVYVFRRSATGWHPAGRVAYPGTESESYFGVNMTVTGDRLIVASPTRGVLAFTRSGDAWTPAGSLTYEGAGPQDNFGMAMAASGEDVLIASPNRPENVGAIHIFRSNGAEWLHAGVIDAPDAETGAFGVSIVVDGDRVLVGAPFSGSGEVHVYRRNGGTYERVETIRPEDAGEGDRFGASIAASGGLLAIGSPQADFGTGRAAIFEGTEGARMQVAMLAGESPEELKAVTGETVMCSEVGEAAQFRCGGVDLLAFLPISAIGGERGVNLNDIWGWKDPQTGKEYALVGRVDGTAFVDVSDPSNPVYVGQLLRTEGSPPSSWRDIKTYRDHAFIVADNAAQHGMQVFDLTRLRQFTGEPIEFTEDAHYDNIASAHNIVINEESGYAYPVGAGGGGTTCGGGLHMIDIRDPKNPTFAGCFSDTETGISRTGYSHDAQCVMYHGPDEEYQGREICIGSNETAISIADVTDKSAPKAISRAGYPNVSYTHQGWFTDDHRYFYVNDEGDETGGLVERTRTLVWDLSDLDDPVLVKEHLGTTAASDHNLYIKGDLMYQSNYASGLRILDISDRENPVEVGFFDTQPVGEDEPGYTGSWSNYPFFDSGIIIVSSIEQGLFIVRKATRPIS